MSTSLASSFDFFVYMKVVVILHIKAYLSSLSERKYVLYIIYDDLFMSTVS